MNSTDQNELETAIRAFCEKSFRPVADKMVRDGQKFFAHNGEAGAASYYEKRERTAMRREDFETPSFRTIDEFADELAAFWRSQGYNALSELTPAMANLARQLQQVEEQTDEVSPFVYVMF